jgi:hypothetical protein
MTVLRACVVCGRPSKGSHCPEHRRKPFEGSTRRRRLPKDWPKRRGFVLRRDPTCRICGTAPATEVHHLYGWQDNRPEALVGVCTPCHRSETGREGRAAQG